MVPIYLVVGGLVTTSVLGVLTVWLLDRLAKREALTVLEQKRSAWR
jgi:hypothetical protein